MKRVIEIVVAITAMFAGSAFLQAQTWTTQSSSITVGDVAGRQAPSAVYLNGTTLVAYTSSNYIGDNNSDAFLYLADNGGSGLSFGNIRPITYNNAGTQIGLTGNNNPSMVVTNDGILFLCFTSGSGQVYLTASGNQGVTWNPPTQLQVNPVQFSPSLAYDSAAGVVWIGLADLSTHKFELCSYPRNTVTLACQFAPEGHQLNYGPSIAVSGGSVFTAIADRGNTHCLYFYQTSTSSGTPSFRDILNCSEQTSAAPAMLASGSATLFVAFRTNDSSGKFTYLSSNDGGASFSGKVQPGFGMGGGPDLTFIQKSPGSGGSLGLTYTANGPFVAGLQN